MTAARIALTAALLFSAVLVQTVVLSRLPLPGATPDLTLLVVIALALAWGPAAGAGVGFTAGLLLDLVPPADGPVGGWALVYLLVGYVAGRLVSPRERSALALLGLVTGLTAAAVLGYCLVGWFLGDPRVGLDQLLRVLVTAVIYAAILTPFVVPGVVALARRIEPRSTGIRL